MTEVVAWAMPSPLADADHRHGGGHWRVTDPDGRTP